MVTRRRRRATAVMTLLSAVVIAISLRTSTQGHSGGGSTQPAGAAPVGVVAAAPQSATTSSASPSKHAKKSTTKPRPIPTPATARPRSVTANGTVIDTMYGPVQVQVTVRGARIVSAHAIDYPKGGGRDQQINSRAIPQLDNETMQAQNARIDTVSGATYTSDGYRRSLQSALDVAHRAA